MTLASPSKINLFLAVTGVRADGYHELVSVTAPLEWGDELEVIPAEGASGFTLECDDPDVPVDGANLVLKAAEAFRRATGVRSGARFVLRKRIPTGAGLGGGSSNAVAALRALNSLCGNPLAAGRLADLAAEIGSDCPQFLCGGPAVMRGRGERVEPLPEAAAARLRGERVAIFKPGFGVSTAWAYGRLDARGHSNSADAERRLSEWTGDRSLPASFLMFNCFESVVFPKFIVLPMLVERLRSELGLAACLSGSGSACFAFLRGNEPPAGALEALVRAAWGPSAFVRVTAIA
jgi:4-diphosphocytidyl-2-C-methyl-D-erythritol kinase